MKQNNNGLFIIDWGVLTICGFECITVGYLYGKSNNINKYFRLMG